MTKIRHITIVGSGLAAKYFSSVLHHHGFVIDAILSRNATKGKALAKLVDAAYSDDFTQIIYSDLVLLCVKDDAIKDVIKDLSINKGIIAHCAGGIDLDVLNQFDQRAVIYPLQTLVLNANNAEVPILLEANTKPLEETLMTLIKKCHLNGHIVHSESRRAYHLAAVFANNFSNAIMHATENISDNFQLDFNLLKPLLKHTIQNVMDGNNAKNLQTGPAKRHDTVTMNKHKDLLKSKPELKNLYEAVSKFIASSQDNLKP